MTTSEPTLTPISPEQLGRLRELLEKATPGPWKTCGASDDNCMCGLIWSIPADESVASTHTSDDGVVIRPETNDNTRLIAQAVNALPALLDLAEKAAALLKATAPRPDNRSDYEYCLTCGRAWNAGGPQIHAPGCEWRAMEESVGGQHG